MQNKTKRNIKKMIIAAGAMVFRVYSEYYDDVAESCPRLTKSVEDMVNADASYDVSYSDNYQAEYVQNYETNYSTDYSYDFSDGF